MKILIKKMIIFVTLFIVTFGGLIGGTYVFVKFRDKVELKKEQEAYEERVVMDVQPLLDYARAIMGGQVLEEEADNQLYRYNFNKELFPTAVSFKVDLRLMTAKHDFHTGYVDIIYTRKYFDDTGECIKCDGNIPATWEIEKKGQKWCVTKIYEDSGL